MNPLQRLEACGQAPWLDNLKRSLLEGGGLKALIDNDGLKGVTSNPSIFEKAIAESSDYDEALKRFLALGDHGVSDIYEHLALADIRAAADILAPVHVSTGGRDGYVSLECSPYLADDTEATVVEALRLWAAVDRVNLMVKVPATPAGIPAIRRLIGQGLNINVTLLFAVSAYEQVAEAYIGGLEDFAAGGGDISQIASVASIFVSRIDVAVDKRLGALPDQVLAAPLRGRAAIANAKLAYARYQSLFSGPRWRRLADMGGRTQRLLWASTSVKTSAYRDTLYVEALIGRDTVDTLPPATLDAFRDHGVVTPDAVEKDIAGAVALVAEIEAQGLSLDEVAVELVEDGVAQFAAAFDTLFAVIAGRRRLLLEGDRPEMVIRAGSPDLDSAITTEMEAWRLGGRVRRLWTGDATLWTGADEGRWLDWLAIATAELGDQGWVEGLQAWIHVAAFTDIVLLGMGGSSLGPEVLVETFGRQPGCPRFSLLDSTDPAQIRTLEAAIDVSRTLFFVSSKSGGTLEPNILLDYFWTRVSGALGVAAAGEHFVAITDPGSSLEARARDLRFAHVFFGAPRIGGRYSVLSKFGLAPAAAMGLDIQRLLLGAEAMRRACGADVPPAQNPGVQLGVALGVAARNLGRDKITILACPGLVALGPWLEQLLAESTGKIGRGLIPVAGEPLATPELYGADRVFVTLELDGEEDPARREAVEALERAGHPVVRIQVKDVWGIGAEIYRWEMATAVAGAVLGVDPFDQPDVEGAKARTAILMTTRGAARPVPEGQPIFRQDGIALYADARDAAELGLHNSLSAFLRRHFGRVVAGGASGDYVALLAYVERNQAHTRILTGMRSRIRDKTQAATCVGFGPRFQHSTGQAYVGGPNTGVFLQITCDDAADLEIPGHPYSFGMVKSAQAQGVFDVLVDRHRRALRVHLTDVNVGLAELDRALAEALE